MRGHPLVGTLILTAFAFAALFGIYGMLSLSHAAHGSCPLSPLQHTLCASPLEHLGHWETVFTAVFAEILLLCALAVVFLHTAALAPNNLRHPPWRYQSHTPLRPTLLQELFSQGILHRKEPQIA